MRNETIIALKRNRNVLFVMYKAAKNDKNEFSTKHFVRILVNNHKIFRTSCLKTQPKAYLRRLGLQVSL